MCHSDQVNEQVAVLTKLCLPLVAMFGDGRFEVFEVG